MDLLVQTLVDSDYLKQLGIASLGHKVKHVAGYILIKTERGYELEHRVIMRNYIGRELSDKEVVDHLNDIKTDNRIENLCLHATNIEHLKRHRRLEHESSNIDKRECVRCGSNETWFNPKNNSWCWRFNKEYDGYICNKCYCFFNNKKKLRKDRGSC